MSNPSLSLIGGIPAPAASDAPTFRATNPATGEALDPVFAEASPADVSRACELAAAAAPAFARSPGPVRAALLRAIADGIEALGDELTARFTAESGLPRGRAEGERARTCGQLRLFAALAETDAWRDPRHETALPERQPAPRPSLDYHLRALGPVAVFGPANFPLAYAVAGGDTASALAVGCPVLVKAHSSHPGVSALVGGVVAEAVRAAGLPPGVFSLLFGSGRSIGAALVKHPAVRAAGFTGSKAAGRELFNACAARPAPIPFFGELSSLNPVVLLPGALEARPRALAEGLSTSLTLGCGQFCTNPGLILLPGGSAAAEAFTSRLIELLAGTPAAPMLNLATRKGYSAGLARLAGTSGVETLLAAPAETGPGGCHAAPGLFRCDAATFRGDPGLHEEVFGPATLLATYQDPADLLATLESLEGQLTASIHGEEAEFADPASAPILAALEERAGRIVFNGFPTGVEVSAAMVHGGPWPATTDARFTSVGSAALQRWTRPVCLQNRPSV
jgi:NADP-dependent aldehyde dehydrogenase